MNSEKGARLAFLVYPGKLCVWSVDAAILNSLMDLQAFAAMLKKNVERKLHRGMWFSGF